VDDPREAAARRLRLALDMFATGEGLMRQRLRREHSGAPPKEIEARLAAWLHTRPGAELGDAPGRPATWPRRRA